MNESQEAHLPNEFASPHCSSSEEPCITCSDQALPARVLSINRERGLALVEIEQETAEVDVTLIEDVEPGDTLLVHGGVALSLWL
jgi:hypothetical protein